MLKTISSSVGGLHDSNEYTMVDVKFETGRSNAMDAVASHFEDSNSLQADYGEEEEEGLETPSSSPPLDSSAHNKRKRSVPKKFSVDEDENPLHESSGLSVKSEQLEPGVLHPCIDYTTYEDIAVPESRAIGLPEEGWDDAAEEELEQARQEATKVNSRQRDDCPICGDKANGLHYGIYTCEGCKNFFKRSVVLTQKKPYICNNQNNCDVRIVIDMSGIKRKGARCQACRYSACLNAGMYHSGYPRSRGGRHNHSRTSPGAISTPLLKEFLNTGERSDLVKRSRMSFEDGLDSASWDSVMAGLEGKGPRVRGQGSESSAKESVMNIAYDEASGQDSDELFGKSSDIFDTVFRDDLEKEKSKNRELSFRLTEKEKQLKIVERQNENLKRHMLNNQNLSNSQKGEIDRLRNEISRLMMFQSKARNYREQNSSGLADHHDSDVIPSDMLAVSYNE